MTSEIASARAPGSATLHGELEFRGWLPEQGAIAEMLQKLGENLGPEGLKDGDKVNAAMTEEMSAATDRFFTPELRAVIAQRMRDAAISVRSRKGDARAVDVLAIARAIEEAGLITSPPREIPFLVLFFQKAISYMAQQSGGQIRIRYRPARRPKLPQAPERVASRRPGGGSLEARRSRSHDREGIRFAVSNDRRRCLRFSSGSSGAPARARNAAWIARVAGPGFPLPTR